MTVNYSHHDVWSISRTHSPCLTLCTCNQRLPIPHFPPHALPPGPGSHHSIHCFYELLFKKIPYVSEIFQYLSLCAWPLTKHNFKNVFWCGVESPPVPTPFPVILFSSTVSAILAPFISRIIFRINLSSYTHMSTNTQGSFTTLC